MTPTDLELIDTIAAHIITNVGTYNCQPTLTAKESEALYRIIYTPLPALLSKTTALSVKCQEKLDEIQTAIKALYEKGADLKSRRHLLKLAEELDQLAA